MHIIDKYKTNAKDLWYWLPALHTKMSVWSEETKVFSIEVMFLCWKAGILLSNKTIEELNSDII